jgi:hypothetical protein
MPNIQYLNFNKNVSMVYVEENGFTGYRGFDFTKIDEVETKLTTLQTTINSGLNFGIDVHQDDLSYLVDSVDARGPYVESLNSKIFATGDSYPAGVQGTIVFQADLSPQFDGVQTYPEQSLNISNYGPSGLNGTIMNANAYRRELYIQNLSTGKLYVKYGADIDSNSFNFILAANTKTDAGDGGSLTDQSYAGLVSVSGSVLTDSPRYIAWERS